MKVMYVGTKPEETAWGHLTGGIVWKPDSVHEIADETLARRMVKDHPDVWADASTRAAPPAAAPAPAAAQSDTAERDWLDVAEDLKMTEAQAVAIDKAGGPGTEAGAALWKEYTGQDVPPGVDLTARLESDDGVDIDKITDDAAVRQFAKDHGLKIQGLNLMKGENLRAKVKAALAAKAGA